MKFKKTLITGAILLATQSTYAYDVVERYKLIDDKLKTDALFRPLGHDFLFDINVSLNKNLLNTVNDIKDAANNKSLSSAQNVLNKYENTEQSVKINLNIGVPLFSFSAFDVKVKPNIRVMADIGANLGIRKDILTAADAFKLINTSVPDAVLANFTAAWWDNTATGADLFSTANCTTYFGTPAAANAFCLLNQGKYFKPDTSVPNVNFYAKVDGKVGFFNDYTYGDHFFGDLNLYALSRTDINQIVNASMVAAGTKIDLPKTNNTELTGQLDYHLGYTNSNYNVSLGAEEIKLLKMKERSSNSRAQSFGYDPLIRLNADAMFKFSVLSLQPFAGVHSRSGYGFGDGVYFGATAGAHVWGDRLGLSLRGMLDKDYLTINPRIKLWLMQIEYSLKAPIKSTDGDMKLAAINTIDFRLFF